MGIGLFIPVNTSIFLKLNQSPQQTIIGDLNVNGSFYSNTGNSSYNLDLGVIDGYGNRIPAGFKPDYYHLPILDMGINAAQFGGISDTTSGIMGSLFRLDNRGYYPYFQLIRQPADDTYAEYGDFMITTNGEMLVGDGWNFSNTGTGNGQDLQVFDSAYVGRYLQIESIDGYAGFNLTEGANYGTFYLVGGNSYFQSSGDLYFQSNSNIFFNSTPGGNLLMPTLPTSSSGLPSGALWNNSGILSIA